jgi:hypothetical protein
MSDYVMGVTVGVPGQTSAIVIVSRVKEYGPRDPVTWGPRITQKLNVAHCERLPAGLKDSEIAGHLDILLGHAPYAGHTRVFIEHPGGKEAIRRMRDQLRPGLATREQGVKVVQDSDGTRYTPDGLRRTSQREMVSYLVPICADAELQNSFPELTQQLLAADPSAAWREGDSDLASALFLAAWFSRGPIGGPRAELLC